MDAGRELYYRHDAAGIVDAQRSRAAFVDPTCGVQAAFWFAPTTVAAKLFATSLVEDARPWTRDASA